MPETHPVTSKSPGLRALALSAAVLGCASACGTETIQNPDGKDQHPQAPQLQLSCGAAACADSGLTLVEGRTAQLRVRLSAKPAAPVTVQVASAQDGFADFFSLSPSSLQLTADNWSAGVAVTVIAKAVDGDAAPSFELKATAAGATSPTLTLRFQQAAVPVTALRVNPTTLTLVEAASGAQAPVSFEVFLPADAAPDAPLKLKLTPSAPDKLRVQTADPQLAAGASRASIALVAQPDTDRQDDQLTVTVAAVDDAGEALPTYAPAVLDVQITDQTQVGVVLVGAWPTTWQEAPVNSPAGHTPNPAQAVNFPRTLSFKLNAPLTDADGEVTVTVAKTGDGISAPSPATLRFSAHDQAAKEVQVTTALAADSYAGVAGNRITATADKAGWLAYTSPEFTVENTTLGITSTPAPTQLPTLGSAEVRFTTEGAASEVVAHWPSTATLTVIGDGVRPLGTTGGRTYAGIPTSSGEQSHFTVVRTGDALADLTLSGPVTRADVTVQLSAASGDPWVQLYTAQTGGDALTALPSLKEGDSATYWVKASAAGAITLSGTKLDITAPAGSGGVHQLTFTTDNLDARQSFTVDTQTDSDTHDDVATLTLTGSADSLTTAFVVRENGVGGAILPPPSDYTSKVSPQTLRFFHESTGKILMESGTPEAYAALRPNDTLTHQNHVRGRYGNKPEHYKEAWITNNGLDGVDEGIVIFKICYTNDPLPNEWSLTDRQAIFNELKTKLNSYTQKKFIIWTIPPLTTAEHNGYTHDPAAQQRPVEFYHWMVDTWDIPGDNIFIFDYRMLATRGRLTHLAVADANAAADSHPNRTTLAPFIAPCFARRMADVANGDGDTTSKLGGCTIQNAP